MLEASVWKRKKSESLHFSNFYQKITYSSGYPTIVEPAETAGVSWEAAETAGAALLPELSWLKTTARKPISF